MNVVLGIGLIMLIGFVGGRLAVHLKLPSLTGYIVFGLILGPYTFGFIPESTIEQLKDPVSLVAVSIIAFMLGGELPIRTIKSVGSKILQIAVADSIWTFIITAAALAYIARLPLYLSLPLAALAASPAPTVVVPVVKELQAKGSFTNILLMVSALEDITCVILISIAITFARPMLIGGSPTLQAFLLSSGEIIGSALLGALLGYLLKLVLDKIPAGQTHLILTITMIFLTAGLADTIHFSPLITVLSLGFVVYNYSVSSPNLFSDIEEIANPIMLLFFTTAGATLDPGLIPAAGFAVVVYITARIFSKFTGVYLTAKIIGMKREVYKNLPYCLLSQAGTTIGLTMIVARQLPEIASNIITVMLSAVIFFEIIAPPLTRNILIKLGECHAPGLSPDKQTASKNI